jgi:hypothetical protein
VTRAGWLAAVAVAAVACSKGKEAPPPGPARPPPIPQAERQRSTDACRAYAKALCACAEAHPERGDLEKRCSLDGALPDALKLAIGVDDEAKVTPDELRRAHRSARRITSTCVEGVAQLPAIGCQPQPSGAQAP